jgi:acyl-CoA thioesterase FadM
MARPPPFERAELEGATASRLEEARTVRFQDVDAAGTIFFPRILEYFADAYVALLLARGVDVPARLREKAWFAPLVHAEGDFLAPMRFGDRVRVAVVAAKVFSSSYAVGYRIRAAEADRALAVGHTVHVVVDGATFQSIPVPDEVRSALVG